MWMWLLVLARLWQEVSNVCNTIMVFPSYAGDPETRRPAGSLVSRVGLEVVGSKFGLKGSKTPRGQGLVRSVHGKSASFEHQNGR